ncbi:MAG: GtrA family protein [Clostridia bacterium]|nr:GtrA family protein [Clostridia bacterium]
MKDLKLLFENDNIKKTLIQFIKFGLVGVSNTAISLGVYYIFIYFNTSLYLLGYTVGFIVSVLNAYYLNNRFVFEKVEEGNAKPLIKTFISYGSTYLLGLLLMAIMVENLGVSENIAPLINLIITIPLNFLLNKFWAFK